VPKTNLHLIILPVIVHIKKNL